MPQTTILITTREQFSHIRKNLESIYAHTPQPFDLIYVNSGAPPSVSTYLKQQAREKGFQFIEFSHHVHQNYARNVGLKWVKTPYVMFLDNDVEVTPGWLKPLLTCAEETGAWIVGPLVLLGPPEDQIIHFAGGEAGIKEVGEQRIYHSHMQYCTWPVSAVPVPLRRQETINVEFHGMLVRKSALDQIGGLDEKIYSTSDHFDIGLEVNQRGGKVIFEPASVIAYHPPLNLDKDEREIFRTRWSEAWNQATLDHFYSKWGLTPNLKKQEWIRKHRRKWLFPIFNRVERMAGKRGRNLVEKLISPLEIIHNRLLYRLPQIPHFPVMSVHLGEVDHPNSTVL